MIVTIAERKDRKRERLRAAAREVCAELARYATAHAGRYLLFGSFARGEERFDSDFDVLVDFPEPAARAAREFVEERCRFHGLTPDIHMRSEASPELLSRIARDGVPLT